MMPLLHLVLIVVILSAAINAETYECTVEEYGPDKRQFCVFRNVQFLANMTDIAFAAPTEKQPNVVFEDCEMDHIPKQFLEKFGGNLKVLNVSNCNLKSVVITSGLEELHAYNNYITKVIVHQSAQNSPMKDIYLQSNRLRDISNITKNCKNARIVDLSRNQEMSKDSELDMAMFNGFNQLEYLLLADVGALYLKYGKDVSLPALRMLDLSQNSLLPSDLQVDYFQKFQSLETLRLTDNGFAQLDYAHLTKMKSLKAVYLEGNQFSCDYLNSMVEFLKNNSVEVPVARPKASCQAGFKVVHSMCCKTEALVMPPKTSTATSTSTTARPDSVSQSTVPTKEVASNRPAGRTPEDSTGTPKDGNPTGKGGAATVANMNLATVLFGLVAFLLSRE